MITAKAKWVIDTNDANIPLMAETLGISPFTANVLANRGIRTRNTAIKFLAPDLSHMHDAEQMQDMNKAASLLLAAIDAKEKITVYGDYDVDGVTSTVILYKLIERLGGVPSYYIPQREEEGYGLNMSSVVKLADSGTKLLLTCDNGIAAHKEIAEAKRLGINVIVLDHHEPGFDTAEDGTRTEIIPEADAAVDPKRADCPYPFKALCAGGLAYKFAAYMYAQTEQPFDHEEEYAALAAIATFCDVVDLIDENRIIAQRGLAMINAGKADNLGLHALMKARSLDGKALTAFDIGFIIGPCINATGRLEHAAFSVELFLAKAEQTAAEIASMLVGLNEERKALTADACTAALEALPEAEALDKVLVLYNPKVHESIAGIVAGRIKDRVCRPVIMLTKSADGMVKGSARSIENYHMFEALNANRDLFERFGGHSMAAGLTMAEGNVSILRERLNQSCTLIDDDFVPIVHTDGELTLDEATFELATQLGILAPFGKANREPLFAAYNVLAQPAELIGTAKTTLRFTFETTSGRKIKGISFGKAEAFADMLREGYAPDIVDSFMRGATKGLTVRLDIVFSLEINEYNGNTSVQLRITDFRLHR